MGLAESAFISSISIISGKVLAAAKPSYKVEGHGNQCCRQPAHSTGFGYTRIYMSIYFQGGMG